MKGFGLELRTIGSASDLFREVDEHLKDSGIPKKGINTDVQSQSISHALHKMFQSNKYLDITAIQKCAKIGQIVIAQERLDIYHVMHCVHWNEMTEEYRKMLLAMILDDFREILNPDSINEIKLGV